MSAARTAKTAKVRRCGLRLDPCDVLFFGDGCFWGEGMLRESVLPTPQTLTGAIRTYLLEQAGCDAHGFKNVGRLLAAGSDLASAAQETCGAGWIAEAAIRGPWLCRTGSDAQGVADVFTAVPATLRQIKNAGTQGRSLLRLDPLDKRTILPGWRPPLPGVRPLWSKQRVASQRQAGYLTRKGLQVFLEGGVPDTCDGHFLPAEDIFAFDQRGRMSLGGGRHAGEQGPIAGARFLSLKPGMAFYAEVTLPAAAPAKTFAVPRPLRFGGEGRRVIARQAEPFIWPAAAPAHQLAGRDQGTLVLLTTPGLFDSTRPGQSWLPDCFGDHARLAAAAVAEWLPVSGWDSAAGLPKPTRFAVPAGSVYYFEGGAEFLSDDCLSDSPDDRMQGWGCFARGVWNDV